MPLQHRSNFSDIDVLPAMNLPNLSSYRYIDNRQDMLNKFSENKTGDFHLEYGFLLQPNKDLFVIESLLMRLLFSNAMKRNKHPKSILTMEKDLS